MNTSHPVPSPIWCYFERSAVALAQRLQTAADLVRAWSNGSTIVFQLLDSRRGELGSTVLLPAGRHISEKTATLSYSIDLLVECENAGVVDRFEVVGPADTVLLRGRLDTEVTLQERDVCCVRFGSVTVVFP